MPLWPATRRQHVLSREQEATVKAEAETKTVSSWRPGSHGSSSDSELLSGSSQANESINSFVALASLAWRPVSCHRESSDDYT